MKKIIIIVFLSFVALSFYSCYYDKADLLYPTTVSAPCDTVGTISYLQKVVPILQSQCYGCHAANGAGGGIVMGSYTTDKAIAVNGKLYGSISYAAGFSAMPKGTAKMTVCQLATIKKWISDGAPNN